MNDTSGFALSVTYAECVWIARELLTPCCGPSPGCLGLDVSQTKACPNKINVFVLLSSEWVLSHSSRAKQTERTNKKRGNIYKAYAREQKSCLCKNHTFMVSRDITQMRRLFIYLHIIATLDEADVSVFMAVYIKLCLMEICMIQYIYFEDFFPLYSCQSDISRPFE